MMGSGVGIRTVCPKEFAVASSFSVGAARSSGSVCAVFVGPKGGKLRRSNFHKSVWSKAREKVGLPDLAAAVARARHADPEIPATDRHSNIENLALTWEGKKRAGDGNGTRMTSLEERSSRYACDTAVEQG